MKRQTLNIQIAAVVGHFQDKLCCLSKLLNDDYISPTVILNSSFRYLLVLFTVLRLAEIAFGLVLYRVSCQCLCLLGHLL